MILQSAKLDVPVGYNITHDSGVIAMAFSSVPNLHPDPPAYRIGIDIMLLQLPKRDTFSGFVEIFSDQVGEVYHPSDVSLKISGHTAYRIRAQDLDHSSSGTSIIKARGIETILPHMDPEGGVHEGTWSWYGVRL